MEPVSKLVNNERGPTRSKPQAIDWEATAKNRKLGMEEVVFRKIEPTTNRDLRLASIVVEEFLGHTLIVSDFITSQEHLNSVDSVRKISHRLKRWHSRITTAWNKIVAPDHPERFWATENLKPHLRLFRQLILTEENSSDKKDINSYLDATSRTLQDAGIQTSRLKRILEWRRRYIALDAGIGLGTELGYIRTRTDHFIFEIWCFVELASVLDELGKGRLIQRSLLRRQNKKQFTMGDEGGLYYDFLGNEATGYSGNRILAESHVEWFFDRQENRRNSVVIDTKYKDWESKDNLTVLGYMNDFDVDRGAVIFSGELRDGAYNASFEEDGIVVTSFGRSQEKLFCALCLKPEESFHERNRIVLREFARRFILQ